MRIPLVVPPLPSSERGSRREGFAWVSSVLDDLVLPLRQVGREWGPHTGLPWGVPVPLILLTAYSTLLHRYNPATSKLEIAVSFGWYYLQGNDPLPYEEEEEHSSYRQKPYQITQSSGQQSEISEEGSELSYGNSSVLTREASEEVTAGSDGSTDFYRPMSDELAGGSSGSAFAAIDKAQRGRSESLELSEGQQSGMQRPQGSSSGRIQGRDWAPGPDGTAVTSAADGSKPGLVSWHVNSVFDSDTESSFVSEESDEDRERLVRLGLSFEGRREGGGADSMEGSSSNKVENGGETNEGGKGDMAGSRGWASENNMTLLELLSEVASRLFETASRGNSTGEDASSARALFGTKWEFSAVQTAFKYVPGGMPRGGGFQELAEGLPPSELALIIIPRPNGSLLARWRYNKAVYDEPYILRLAANYRHLVERIAMISRILEREKLSDLPVLSQTEQDLVERCFSRQEPRDSLWEEDSWLQEGRPEVESAGRERLGGGKGRPRWQEPVGPGATLGDYGNIRETSWNERGDDGAGLSEGLPPVQEEEEEETAGEEDKWRSDIGARGMQEESWRSQLAEDGREHQLADSGGGEEECHAAENKEKRQERQLAEGLGPSPQDRVGSTGLIAIGEPPEVEGLVETEIEESAEEAKSHQGTEKENLSDDVGGSEASASRLAVRELLSELGFDSRQTDDEWTLVDIFQRQAGNRPDAVAVSDSLEKLTYRELLLRAASIASFLRAKLSPGGKCQEGRLDVVGIGMTRCVDWVAAILGTLMAGKAYAQLDPSCPRLYHKEVLEQTALKLVLTNRECLEGFLWAEGWGAGECQMGVRVCTTGSLRGEALDKAGLAEVRPEPGDACTVLFNSFVSGKPGGVVLEHRGLINMLKGLSSHLPVGSQDIIGQCCAATREVYLLELFGAFRAGAQIAICSKQDVEQDLTGFVQRNRVTGLVLPSSLASRLEPTNLLSLSWLVLGSEMVPRDLVAKWTDGGKTVVEYYGATECSGAVCGATWQPGDKTRDDNVRPIPGAHVYILGRQLELLPIGVPGEVCVAGCQLARGCLRNLELAAQAFVPNPFMTDLHDTRLYRTGDLARWHANGAIELLGRVDRQITLRGHQVQPEEIEAVIGQVEEVRRCIVTLRSDDPHRGPYLAAYLTAKASVANRAGPMGSPLLRNHPPQEALIGKVWRYLRGVLPPYMVPTAVMLLDHFPVSGSGEVDLETLPRPQGENFLGIGRHRSGGSWDADEAEGVVFRAPLLHSPEELAVAVLFSEILPGVEVSKLSPQSNFFELGGNSLLANQVVAELSEYAQRKRGVVRSTRGSSQLTIRHFFESPTVGSLAAALRGSRAPSAGSQKSALRRTRSGGLEEVRQEGGEGELRIVGLGDEWVAESPDGQDRNGEKVQVLGLRQGLGAGLVSRQSSGSVVLHDDSGTATDSSGEYGLRAEEITGAPQKKQKQPTLFQLSHAQWLVWVAMHSLPDPEALNVCHVWKLRGPLDVKRLGEALRILVRRHNMLRISRDVEGQVSARELKELASLFWGAQVAELVLGRGQVKPSGFKVGGSGRAPKGADGVQGWSEDELGGWISPGSRGPGAQRSPGSPLDLEYKGKSTKGCVGQGRHSGAKGGRRKDKAGLPLDRVWQAVLDSNAVDFKLEETSVQEVAAEGSSVSSPSRWVALGMQRTLVQRLTQKARRLPQSGDSHSGLSIRALLVQVNETEHVLVLTWSRLIGDRISAAVLFRELQQVYETGTPEELPAVVSFQKLVEADRKVAQGKKVEPGAVAYWEAQLRELEALTLGGQKAQTAQAAPRQDWVDFTIAAGVSAKLEQLAIRCGATLSMALLAAFHALLHLWSGQLRVCVGTLLGQRPTQELQGIVGPISDVVPILTDLRQRRGASASPPASSTSSRPTSASPMWSPSTNSTSVDSPALPSSRGGASRGVPGVTGGSTGSPWRDTGRAGHPSGSIPWQARGSRGSQWLAEPSRPSWSRGNSRLSSKASTRNASEAASREGTPTALKFEHVLEQVKERTIGALEHQRVSVCHLAVQMQNHLQQHTERPLIPAFFSFAQPGVDSPPLEMGLGDDVVAEYDAEESGGVEPGAALAPIALVMRPEGNGSLVGRMLFQAAMFYPEVIDAAVHQFEHILEAALQNRPLEMAPRFTTAVAAAQTEEEARPKADGVCLPSCCGNFSGMD